ncbi:DUF1129 family protein [Psychrobacillus sp. OK032]|uniref:DUF1129 family protein n=1 Tax=Psychrobacillus sp. OK032 TaxID=1884358 RepID=UPI0008D4F9F8|nr:DUF1129 family protein [Psychrobacillus sp. OK032]SES00923.1 Uncharacterized membrane-anchored protein [Psychrobacillus sp. OK032]
MTASELIAQNNLKRDLLTEENEKYYSNLLIYIRTKLSLSEQQSEEVLMEMLDHLLEGQQEGKTARDIFGNDPKGYADEIISHLPEEEKRNSFKFVSQVAVNLLGWFLVIRSIAILVIGQMQEVDSSVFIIPSIIILVLIALLVRIGVKVIFSLIHKSLFDEKSNDKKMMVRAGLFGSGGFLIVIVASYFMRDFGPSFEFPWIASLGVGAVLLLISWIMKNYELKEKK